MKKLLYMFTLLAVVGLSSFSVFAMSDSADKDASGEEQGAYCATCSQKMGHAVYHKIGEACPCPPTE